ncbi:hypothetical protein KC357_g267 [Hortaea werneckii]|nr:hypothetical protein KC357_g267 [Hortaea werneckii]
MKMPKKLRDPLCESGVLKDTCSSPQRIPKSLLAEDVACVELLTASVGVLSLGPLHLVCWDSVIMVRSVHDTDYWAAMPFAYLHTDFLRVREFPALHMPFEKLYLHIICRRSVTAPTRRNPAGRLGSVCFASVHSTSELFTSFQKGDFLAHGDRALLPIRLSAGTSASDLWCCTPSSVCEALELATAGRASMAPSIVRNTKRPRCRTVRIERAIKTPSPSVDMVDQMRTSDNLGHVRLECTLALTRQALCNRTTSQSRVLVPTGHTGFSRQRIWHPNHRLHFLTSSRCADIRHASRRDFAHVFEISTVKFAPRTVVMIQSDWNAMMPNQQWTFASAAAERPYAMSGMAELDNGRRLGLIV